MNIAQIILSLNIQDIIPIVFKTLAIIFSVFYLFYTIIIYRQTDVMNQAVRVKNNFIILTISILQIGIAVFLVIWSILLI